LVKISLGICGQGVGAEQWNIGDEILAVVKIGGGVACEQSHLVVVEGLLPLDSVVKNS